MKKKNLPYSDELIKRFIEWLGKLPAVNKTKKNKTTKDIKYTGNTIRTYIELLNRFCNEFYSAKNTEPLKQFVQHVQTPMMCSCFFAMTQATPNLNKNEMQYLAEAFWYYCSKNNNIPKGDFLFKKNRFQKMIRFFYQNKLGVKYCRIVNLFFEFLKSINWNDNTPLYEKVSKDIENIKKNRWFNIKYWYIEATDSTPALIMGKANQSKISIADLHEIMPYDLRTIKKAIESEGYPYLAQSNSFWIDDVNDFFLKKHSEFSKRYSKSVPITKAQVSYIKDEYEYLLGKIQELKIKNSQPISSNRKNYTASILMDINSYLSAYSSHLDDAKEHWKYINDASNIIKKPIRTLQRHGNKKKIPTLSYSKRKLRYFCG